MTPTTLSVRIMPPGEPLPIDGVVVVPAEIRYSHVCLLPGQRSATTVSLFAESDAPWLELAVEPRELQMPIHFPCALASPVTATGSFEIRAIAKNAPSTSSATVTVGAVAERNDPHEGTSAHVDWDLHIEREIALSKNTLDEEPIHAVPAYEAVPTLGGLALLAARALRPRQTTYPKTA